MKAIFMFELVPDDFGKRYITRLVKERVGM